MHNYCLDLVVVIGIAGAWPLAYRYLKQWGGAASKIFIALSVLAFIGVILWHILASYGFLLYLLGFVGIVGFLLYLLAYKDVAH